MRTVNSRSILIQRIIFMRVVRQLLSFLVKALKRNCHRHYTGLDGSPSDDSDDNVVVDINSIKNDDVNHSEVADCIIDPTPRGRDRRQIDFQTWRG
jgi:hypothetical protein